MTDMVAMITCKCSNLCHVTVCRHEIEAQLVKVNGLIRGYQI